jgi:hypothetical protein
MIVTEFDAGFVQVLYMVVTILLPILVGLVTKQSWSSGAKAVLLAGLAVLIGLGTEALNAAESNTPYDLQVGALAAVQTFVIAVATHFGLWKPTGATEAAQNSVVRDGPNRYISR